MKDTINEQLVNFKVTINKFDSFLLNYGPVLVLGQFILSGLAIILNALYIFLSESPKMITWAVLSPVYGGILLALLAESIAVRYFLNKIPQTFSKIWAEGLIKRTRAEKDDIDEFQKFISNFERELNARQRLYIGLPFATFGLVFFWITGHLPYVIDAWFHEVDWAAKIIITLVNFFALFLPAVLIGYATGISAWKSVVTAIHVRRFCKDFDLVIQPSHPDKSGGLKPLGSLIFSLAVIVIVASLALSGMVILADYYSFPNTILFSKASLAISILLSIIIFIWPLLSAHERMNIEKTRMNLLLVDITRRISELEEVTQKNIRKMDYRKRQEIFSEIDSLKDLYRRVGITPTWPFDRDILLKFATPQIFSLLSLIGVAEPIVGAIRSILVTISGNQP